MKKLPFIVLAFVILIRALFTNVNAAEWGDSYRILRAAEYLRNYQYPSDEKRAPLFSLILAARPSKVDPVQWGRAEMLVITALLLTVFTYYVRYFISSPVYQSLSIALLGFNPVFFYWSLRIMADVPFLLLVLCSFYLLKRQSTLGRFYWQKSFILGILGALGVLVRFEGYILICALFIGIIFLERGFYSWEETILQRKNLQKTPSAGKKRRTSKIPATVTNLKNIIRFVFSQLNLIFNLLRKKNREILAFVTAQLFILVPYWYYRNPLSSSYFEEPSGRSYDLNTFLIYFASLFFISGFVPFFSYIFFRPAAGSLSSSTTFVEKDS
ncbi:glycosyltransferase family 39 protein, partial [candidate division WWE3 bacterium]|nr:glycosyltransferase family 39 protein [candidate division WWE3 bacterium]